jgi:hypothetical protein
MAIQKVPPKIIELNPQAKKIYPKVSYEQVHKHLLQGLVARYSYPGGWGAAMLNIDINHIEWMTMEYLGENYLWKDIEEKCVKQGHLLELTPIQKGFARPYLEKNKLYLHTTTKPMEVCDESRLWIPGGKATSFVIPPGAEFCN